MYNYTYNPNIAALQRELGMTGADLDGKRGPKTLAAILAAADAGRLSLTPAPVIIKEPESPEGEAPADRDLIGVHDDLVGVILEAKRRLPDVPFDVIEGRRTIERQKQLVARGASKTMNSRHITGHAADLWPIDPATGKNRPSDAQYPHDKAKARAASNQLWADLRIIASMMKTVAKERGLPVEWGGDWGWDAPHFQLSHRAYPA